ncbi:hypothetical protein OQ968_13595 [Mycobacterium sp. 663a-19]|uniref:hypothetical protein n=1 Tax=Mycobacterium sp. 663a-19 TaxID=2986148 RepID=UPI002D1F94C9|nr:hypothetical protein [Mycobacterium sp. 663a-19]MEB3982298.1 hypothetical protein [Mycobacterium sp. 663a-19]
MHAELDRLLVEQGGVVSARQVLAFATRRGLEGQLKRGALQKVWHGIYGRGEVTAALRLRGLDLLAGTTVAACMHTAAAAYGFDTEDTSNLHVLNPGGRRLHSTRGLVVHRRDGAPLTVIRGRPATAPSWTAIEVARSLRRPRALATLDAALRSRMCSPGELARAIELQSGRRGVVKVRELLPLASPLAESPMESEARLVMIDGGLPRPVLQYELIDLTGRLWRLDFAWPEFRVAAEYDGVDWHSGPDAFRRDRKRSAALQDLSWVVVPIIAEDVRYQPAQLVRRLDARLSRAA